MRTVAMFALCAALPAALTAQSLASRVQGVRDGTIRMRFAARPGVCGDGEGSVWISDGRHGRFDDGGQRPCLAGPVRVAIGRADGEVVSVRSRVGGSESGGAELDLGEVPAPEAARYLIGLARTLGGRSAGQAVSAAAFADAPDIWPDFARLIRDRDAGVEPRKDALFWLGQSDAPTAELVQLYDALDSEPLREQYTFVMSQRHDDAALDKLIDIARHDRDLDIRKRAMFWLGQSHDPKAIKFFHDVLVR
jgi:hypothetical protein